MARRTRKTNQWTGDLEKLLRTWKKNLVIRQKGHRKMSISSKNKNWYLSALAILLSTITTTGTFITYQDCKESDCSSFQAARISMAVISGISAAIAAFSTFANFSAKSETHKSSANKCEDLIRKIDIIINTRIEDRGNAIETIKEILDIFSQITKNSPLLDEQYDKQLEYEVVDTKIKAPKPSDVRIDIDDKKLAKMVLEDIKNTEKIVKESNNYDSDTDENKKVTLPFDIEKIQPKESIDDQKTESSIKRIVSNYNFSTEEQKSLEKNIEYELRRLQKSN